VCGADVSLEHQGTPGHQFLCPGCGAGLRFRKGTDYSIFYFQLAPALAATVAYTVGIRGVALLVTTLFGMFPIFLVLFLLDRRLSPPADAVEPTGDFRDMLYGAHRAVDLSPASDLSRGNQAEEAISSPLPEDPRRPAEFAVREKDRRFGGLLLRGAAFVFALSLAWLPYHLSISELAGTKNGPSTFPVTVHIGDRTITFTNGSTNAWSCKTHLGAGQSYASNFALESQHTRELSYLDFGSGDTDFDVNAMRSAAREKISITCVEPSGRTHFWEFN
jgi:hypothetical protein